MAYFRTCPLCGCNLDPGERCDCETEKQPEPPPGTRQSRNIEPGLMTRTLREVRHYEQYKIKLAASAGAICQ